MTRDILFIFLAGLSITCCAAAEFNVPDGYVLQTLDAINGKIARPPDWFYSSENTSTGHIWTIAAEDMRVRPYETGMRVQLILDVEKETHKSPEDFAQSFFQKKRDTTKVISDCGMSDHDEYKRQCLEVEEEIQRPEETKTYRIVYSAIFGILPDSLILTTFGAPKEKWDSVEGICKVMSHIQLFSDRGDSVTEAKRNDLKAFVTTSIFLYQPDEPLKMRIGGSAAPLVRYINELKKTAESEFTNFYLGTGLSGAIVVAVKPGKSSRIWLDLGDNDLPVATTYSLISDLESVSPLDVQNGVVVFAILFNAWGGGNPPMSMRTKTAPVPREWREVMPKLAGRIFPDSVVEMLWPDL